MQPFEPVVAERCGGRTQSDDLRMRRWIVVAQDAVLPARDDVSIGDDDCADRHLACLRCFAGLGERRLAWQSMIGNHNRSCPRLQGCRLLLGHAMQRAESPDQIDAVDADDLAIGKQLGQNVQRHAVVGIMKCRHQHQPIGDIEIRIAGGQALAAKDDGARQRQFDDRELLSVQRARGLEAREILGQRLVVRIVRIRLDGGDDRRSGPTKRVMSSTWPWVSSPAMPRPSQIT